VQFHVLIIIFLGYLLGKFASMLISGSVLNEEMIPLHQSSATANGVNERTVDYWLSSSLFFRGREARFVEGADLPVQKDKPFMLDISSMQDDLSRSDGRKEEDNEDLEIAAADDESEDEDEDEMMLEGGGCDPADTMSQSDGQIDASDRIFMSEKDKLKMINDIIEGNGDSCSFLQWIREQAYGDSDWHFKRAPKKRSKSFNIALPSTHPVVHVQRTILVVALSHLNIVEDVHDFMKSLSEKKKAPCGQDVWVSDLSEFFFTL
jgi:hypothetical protein